MTWFDGACASCRPPFTTPSPPTPTPSPAIPIVRNPPRTTRMLLVRLTKLIGQTYRVYLHAELHRGRISIRRWESHYDFGGLAQLAERVLSMHEVLGSIPKFSRAHKRNVMLLTLPWGEKDGETGNHGNCYLINPFLPAAAFPRIFAKNCTSRPHGVRFGRFKERSTRDCALRSHAASFRVRIRALRALQRAP